MVAITGLSVACPLCGSSVFEKRELARWEEIVDSLAEYAAAPPPTELSALAPDDEIALVACTECGLEHFAPTLAGDGAFYAYLYGGASGYDKDRWDFVQAREIIDPAASVVDLGCGEGNFLASLPNRRRVGVDHNVSAVDAARDRGIETYCGTPRQVQHEIREQFDVVCSFQTIEHLLDVDEVVVPALNLAKPGALILISTPNREHLAVNEPPALDWPPHHLSRWSADQYHEMAARKGLELLEVRVDRRSTVQALKVAAYVVASRGLGRSPLKALGEAAEARLHLDGLRLRHTMLGVFRKPT